MQEEARQPNRNRLRAVFVGSMLIAVLGVFTFWRQVSGSADMGWIWWLMLATIGMIIYGIVFYFGVMIFENTLEQYVVSDTFKKKHDWIDVETETRTSHDGKIDGWVRNYVFARTMFAMGILPLLACIYLFFIM